MNFLKRCIDLQRFFFLETTANPPWVFSHDFLGSRMKKQLLHSILILSVLAASDGRAQISFASDIARLTTPNFRSGCSVAVVDWNGDGLDDIVRLKNGHEVYVEINRPDSTFQTIIFGDMGNSSAWSMGVADIDKNGFKDIVAYTSGSIKLMMISDSGTTGTLSVLPGSNFFAQNLTFGDFNNDGWIDLFACDDNAPSHIFMNDGAGVLLPATNNVINFYLPGSDNSGNYGSTYIDFDNDGDLDLYIAKCRQGVSNPADPRRIDVLFVNNGDGTYTERAAEFGVANRWQTWTASFGDIDNDGDLDLMATNHDYMSQIFENDGSGHYTDITGSTLFNISGITPIESVMEDFDNDGFIDILVSGSASILWKNNGNKTFTATWYQGMASFAIGDLNRDGRIDVYGSYAQLYTTPGFQDDVLWMNASAPANNYLTVELNGVISNPGAIGARATLYGDWGKQIREVRSGESYGTVNSSMLHFGLGTATEIDSLVIHWPSGISETVIAPLVDQFIKITENECISLQFAMQTIGETTICEGEPVIISTSISATELYNYLWSNGDTTASITITSPGEYNVSVSEAGNNCTTISNTVIIGAFPDETPQITVSGELNFCGGETVILSGPDSLSSWLWSNGDTTQTILVSESGAYSLSVVGVCHEYTSGEIVVNVTTPELPVADDIIITQPGTAILNAAGSDIVWFDQPVAVTIVATGNSFETPEVTTTATFYAASTITTGGEDFSGGLVNHSGSDYSADPNSNAKMQFDVAENCTLKSVTVMTDTPGNRKIELRNPAGDLINSVTVNIIDSMEVVLDFPLFPGTDYTLGTDGSINLLIPGVNALGPRLKRNNAGTGVAYPYPVGDLLSITGGFTGAVVTDFYFYFYNWKIENESGICYSDLVPVTVTVDDPTGITALTSDIKVFPNPANDYVSVSTADAEASATLFDQQGRIVSSKPVGKNGMMAIGDFASGLYNLRISTVAGVKVMKLVIE